MNRLSSLDGFRGIAITLVLGSHLTRTEGFPDRLQAYWGYIFDGGLGVRVFFVLSGFLITHLLVREEIQFGSVSLGHFYIRRTLRILPVYIAFLTTLALLSTLTSVSISVGGWISSITFTKNFWSSQWIDGHLWSLAVEEQFYLLWPCAFYLLKERGRLVFAMLLILLSPFFRVWFYLHYRELYYYSFFTNMDALMIGSSAAIAFSQDSCRVQRVVNYQVTKWRLVAVFVVYAIWILNQHLLFGFLTVPFGQSCQCIAIAYLIVSCVSVKTGFLFQLLNTRALMGLGTISYGLYLWQQPLMVGRGFYLEGENSWLIAFPWALLSAIILATISYYALEMPFFRLRERFRRVMQPMIVSGSLPLQELGPKISSVR